MVGCSQPKGQLLASAHARSLQKDPDKSAGQRCPADPCNYFWHQHRTKGISGTTRPVTESLTCQGVEILMSVNNWLIQAVRTDICSLSRAGATTLQTVRFLANILKSQLNSTQHIQWLGMIWHSVTQTLLFSLTN